MKKIISLIKATTTDNMNIFRINTKKQTMFSKIFLPIILSFLVMSVIFGYATGLMEVLYPLNMGFVVLTIFILITSIMTFIEGVYKTGSLLFNSKDDNLLLSLPIKKSTVLFIRIFKFYLFELLYNSLFLVPAMIVYIKYMHPNITFYIVSLIAVLLLPIIPILLSSCIGSIISYLSSKFKGQKIAQTILTIILLLGIMYYSYNSESLVTNIANNASNINDFITKIYYPAGAYINLINNFNIIDLLLFISIHLIVFILIILFIGNIYFNINSSVKIIKTNNKNKSYKIKSSNIITAIIKKEINRFINSPVFIINAGFGLVLFIIGCIFISVKYDSLLISIQSMNLSNNDINHYLPTMLFILVCFSSLMTSITSSMISLEGKSFNILKSIPVAPYKIIKSKIYAAVLIMIPCMLIGDVIVFLKFKFDLLSILLIICASFLFPLVSETFGIIINLKYPNMNAKNDTEVVKQSMSSMISVFTGLTMIGITAYGVFKAIDNNIPSILIIFIGLIVYGIIYALLLIYLKKNSTKQFNNILI